MTTETLYSIDTATLFGATLVAKGSISDLSFTRNTVSTWVHVPRDQMSLKIEGTTAYYYVASEYVDFNNARRLKALDKDDIYLPQRVYHPLLRRNVSRC